MDFIQPVKTLFIKLIKHIIRSDWWKYLCVLLLLATTFVSLYFPLAPGLLKVSSNLLSPGQHQVAITGYNTHFDAAEFQAWLRHEDYVLCATEVSINNPSNAVVTFDIPNTLPSDKLQLLIYNTEDEFIGYLKKFYVEGATTSPLEADSTCLLPSAKNSSVPGFTFPNRNILNETIRNLNFHVPMWFAMIFLMLISLIASIAFLNSGKSAYDDAATAAVRVGLLFAFCGLATGSVWARFTWGTWWTADPQLNGAAISTMVYLSYFSLRRSIGDGQKQAKIAAVYAIFAFVMFYVAVKVIPGMADYSLHPDTTDNPSFKDYDVADRLKIVLRLSAVGWVALSFWIFTLRYRIQRIARKRMDA